MIPEIDIWRAAQLMLKRYGDKALEESAARAEELLAACDDTGIADQNTLTRAAEVVAQSPEARANLALLGDKRILLHPAGDSFVTFGIVCLSWVVLGDPIGPFARWRDLLCQLATEAASHGGWPVFFGVGEAAAKICSKLGFAVRRIGDQAIVPLDQFMNPWSGCRVCLLRCGRCRIKFAVALLDPSRAGMALYRHTDMVRAIAGTCCV